MTLIERYFVSRVLVMLRSLDKCYEQLKKSFCIYHSHFVSSMLIHNVIKIGLGVGHNYAKHW